MSTSRTSPTRRSEAPTDVRTRAADREPPDRDPRDGEPRGEERGALVLDRYRLGRRLGSGAFGTVWSARDERLERDVAVKILPRNRIINARFEREARAAARLQHPAIVTLFEAAVDDEGAYLVSELVRGRTLDAQLESGHLSDRAIVEIGVSVCDALAHAHAEGIIHRDVKPSNILVPARPAGAGDRAKLTDFGVAHVVGGDSLTRTGDVIGTAAYMAPEQAEGRAAGPEADLYSLALVLYEALSGVNPIAAHARSGRARRLGQYVPPLRRQRRDLPRELAAAIDLALRPRPRERGTVDHLRAALVSTLETVSEVEGVVAPARTLLTRALDGGEDRTRVRDHDDLGPEWRESGRGADAAAGPRAGGVRVRLAAHIGPRGWTVAAAVALLVLGAAGLAGAWPGVVAAVVRRAWVRAVAGAAGFVWLGAAGAVAHRDLYWRLADADGHALRAAAIAAGIWALAGATGRPLARGVPPRAALALVAFWSAATVAAVTATRVPQISGGVAGAALGAAILAAAPARELIRAARSHQ